jgi:hypothetical protein
MMKNFVFLSKMFIQLKDRSHVPASKHSSANERAEAQRESKIENNQKKKKGHAGSEEEVEVEEPP